MIWRLADAEGRPTAVEADSVDTASRMAHELFSHPHSRKRLDFTTASGGHIWFIKDVK